MVDVAAARRPIPPLEKLAPGLWSIPVPLPIETPWYVFVYVFETDRGPYLVDTGWATDEGWNALCAGLERIGTSISSVQGVLVTHSHPDHYGLAGRIREVAGCWVGMHPAEAETLEKLAARRWGAGTEPRIAEILRAAGAPESEVTRIAHVDLPAPSIPLEPPDRLIEDGALVDVPGWEIRAVWTPGHTPGHLCFALPALNVLLSGDHVLPRTTPNVSSYPGDDTDPLGNFLRSLTKVLQVHADVVYPAHEYRFVDLPGRVAALVEHHERRLREVLDAVESGAETEWAIAERLTWSRPWAQMDHLHRMTALGETAAHIRALAARGEVVSEPGVPTVWRRAREHPIETR